MTKKTRNIGEWLNLVIEASLSWPTGDPNKYNLFAATYAFRALQQLGLPIRSKKSVERTLHGENVCQEDFLADHEGSDP